MNGQTARWTEDGGQTDGQIVDRKSKAKEVKRGRGGVVVVEQLLQSCTVKSCQELIVAHP